MSKKFLAGVFAVAAFAFAITVSAAYDFGATTLKVGSRGEAVKNVQIVVGATPVDGIFGPMTKAKVMAWQAANGLTADGLFGNMSKAKANAVVVTPTTPTTPSTPSTTLKGGAGNLEVTLSSKGTETDVKEGNEEKVLGLKLEADDSDIQVTHAKLVLKNTSSSVGSEKLSDYVEEVKVYLGSKEVGSVDVSDFTRKSGSPDTFTKSIALSNAIVGEDETEYLYVALLADSDLDTSDLNTSLKWSVDVETLRYTDGTGAILSVDGDLVDDVNFLAGSVDDEITLKSTSSNPKDVTVKVYEDDNTDEILALAFKLDVDDDSSDMDLQTIKVVAKVNDGVLTASTATAAEKFIESVVLNIAGEEFDAEDLVNADVDHSADTITYTFDIDGDVTIDAGDVEEAKVYVVFYEQGTAPNYASGSTVKFSVAKTGIEAEVDGDKVASGDIKGTTQAGGLITLNSSAANVTDMRWSVSTSGTIIDFFFKVEAVDEDFTVLYGSVKDSTAGNAVFANSGDPVISKYSGTATATGTNDFVVSEGDNATFRLRYTLDATAGDNGEWAEVTITSVAGQTVPEDKETSPTATVSL